MARYALVIGIGENLGKLTSLTKTVKDAEDVAHVLETHGDYQVTLLTGSISKERLKEALTKLLERQAVNNEALIYYTGHGIPVAGEVGGFEAYLAPSNCKVTVQQKEIRKQEDGFALSDLNKLIERSRLSSLVLLLDCCHSGYVLDGELVRQTLTSVKNDYFVIAACRDFEEGVARKKDPHSLFTGALLEGLSQSQADSYGNVTSDRLFSHIAARLRNSGLQNGGQEPMRLGVGRSLTLVSYTVAAVQEVGEIHPPPVPEQGYSLRKQIIFAITVVAVVIGAIALLFVSNIMQDPLNVLKDSDLDKIAEKMPAIKQGVDKERQKVDTLPEQSDPKGAIADYTARKTQIDNSLVLHQRFLEKVADLKESGKLNSENNKLSQDIEKSLAFMINKYRIPFLTVDLRRRKFGKLNEESEKTDTPDKQFTPGALRTTYEILMTKSGANADLDRNGTIKSSVKENPREANQIPCITLGEIGNLWKGATDQKCGWYGKNADNPHYDPECKEQLRKHNIHPRASTLATIFSENYPDELVSRVKDCENHR